VHKVDWKKVNYRKEGAAFERLLTRFETVPFLNGRVIREPIDAQLEEYLETRPTEAQLAKWLQRKDRLIPPPHGKVLHPAKKISQDDKKMKRAAKKFIARFPKEALEQAMTMFRTTNPTLKEMKIGAKAEKRRLKKEQRKMDDKLCEHFESAMIKDVTQTPAYMQVACQKDSKDWVVEQMNKALNGGRVDFNPLLGNSMPFVDSFEAVQYIPTKAMLYTLINKPEKHMLVGIRKVDDYWTLPTTFGKCWKSAFEYFGIEVPNELYDHETMQLLLIIAICSFYGIDYGIGTPPKGSKHGLLFELGSLQCGHVIVYTRDPPALLDTHLKEKSAMFPNVDMQVPYYNIGLPSKPTRPRRESRRDDKDRKKSHSKKTKRQSDVEYVRKSTKPQKNVKHRDEPVYVKKAVTFKSLDDDYKKKDRDYTYTNNTKKLCENINRRLKHGEDEELETKANKFMTQANTNPDFSGLDESINETEFRSVLSLHDDIPAKASSGVIRTGAQQQNGSDPKTIETKYQVMDEVEGEKEDKEICKVLNNEIMKNHLQSNKDNIRKSKLPDQFYRTINPAEKSIMDPRPTDIIQEVVKTITSSFASLLPPSTELSSKIAPDLEIVLMAYEKNTTDPKLLITQKTVYTVLKDHLEAIRQASIGSYLSLTQIAEQAQITDIITGENLLSKDHVYAVAKDNREGITTDFQSQHMRRVIVKSKQDEAFRLWYNDMLPSTRPLLAELTAYTKDYTFAVRRPIPKTSRKSTVQAKNQSELMTLISESFTQDQIYCGDIRITSMPNGNCLTAAKLIITGMYSGHCETDAELGLVIKALPKGITILKSKPINGTSHIYLMEDKTILSNGFISLERSDYTEGSQAHIKWNTRTQVFEQSVGSNLETNTLDILRSYGVHISDAASVQDNHYKNISNGGHLHSRTIVDAVHTRGLNAMITNLLTGDYDRIIDVGSKINNFHKMLSTLPRDVSEAPSREITVCMVRPEESDRDKNYHRQVKSTINGSSMRVIIKDTLFTLKFVIIKGLVGIDLVPTERDIVRIADAHYYFSNMQIKGLKIVSGLQHSLTHGVYKSLNREMNYTITSSKNGYMTVRQTSRSNGEAYEHPLTWVKAGADKVIEVDPYTYAFVSVTTRTDFVDSPVNYTRDPAPIDWTNEAIHDAPDASRAAMGVRLGSTDWINYKPVKANYADCVSKTISDTSAKFNIDHPFRAQINHISWAKWGPTSKREWIEKNYSMSTKKILLAAGTLASLYHTVQPLMQTNSIRQNYKTAMMSLVETASNNADEVSKQMPNLTKAAIESSSYWSKFKNFFFPKKNSELIAEAVLNENLQADNVCRQIDEWTRTEQNLYIQMKDVRDKIPEVRTSLWRRCTKTIIVAAVAGLALYGTVKAAQKIIRIYKDYKAYVRPDEPQETGPANEKILGIDDVPFVIKTKTLRLQQDLPKTKTHDPNTFRFVKPLDKDKNGFVTVSYNDNLIADHLRWEDIYETIQKENAVPSSKKLPKSAGFKILSTNMSSQPHMWNHQSLQNCIYALFNRQLSAKLKYEESVMKDFQKFVTAQKTNWKNRCENIPTVQEWLKAKDWTVKRKLLYKDNITKQLRGEELEWRNVFNLMVKNGELYYSKPTASDNIYLEGVKDRPRAIMAPTGALLGVLTWVQQLIIDNMKKAYPEFVHAENSQDFWKRTYPEILKIDDPITYSMDMAKHDAHQHADLIKAVDHEIWAHYSNEVIRVLNEHGAIDAPALWSNLSKLIFNTRAKVNVLDKDAKRYGYVIINGTTFSGSPHLTTLGNTMRVIMAHLYVINRANVPRGQYVVRVAGDDAIVWISRKYQKQYEESLYKVLAKESTHTNHGLGMVVEVQATPWYRAEFCSKILIVEPQYPAHGQWVRKPESLLHKGHFYVGNKAELVNDPELYSSMWAAGVAGESKGPIYLEIAMLRNRMGKYKFDPYKHSHLIEHKWNLNCKNDFDPMLTNAYIREIAASLRVSQKSVLDFWKCLIDMLTWYQTPGVGHIELPLPELIDHWTSIPTKNNTTNDDEHI